MNIRHPQDLFIIFQYLPYRSMAMWGTHHFQSPKFHILLKMNNILKREIYIIYIYIYIYHFFYRFMKHVPIPPLFCFCWLTQAPAHPSTPSPPSPRHLRQEDRCHDNHLHLMARGASPLPEMGEVSLSLSIYI